MKKKSIYILCPKLSGRGGMESIIGIVANQLKKDNYHVTVYIDNTPRYCEWVKELKSKNVNVICGNKFLRTFIFYYLFIFGSQQKIFIVAGTSRFASTGIKLRKILRKKWKMYYWLHFSLKHNMNYKYLSKVDGILTISSAIAKQLRDIGVNEEKINLVYNPFILNNSRIESLPEKRRHFVYIGRLEEKQKNVSELLKAIGHTENIYLDVFGDGPDMKKYKQLSKKLGIDQRVYWHGWKKHVWKAIDFQPEALVLPSNFEGFPMILLEAMGKGIPCITSDFLGYKDIIQDHINGEHYDLGNEYQLSKLLKSFDRNNYSRKAIINSIDRYNASEYFKKFYSAIDIQNC